MPAFDFITGDDFRRSLEADAIELEKCMAGEAWKAAHVLAGSIIEAILCDFLVASEYQKSGSGLKDPRKMVLAELVDACRTVKVLSERTGDLCSAVRDYRNLIHPGRVTRLGESIDGNSARIAASLVEVIADDVAKRRRAVYGLTAEQLLEKLEADATSIAILSDLMVELNDTERERLVLDVLPAEYLSITIGFGRDDPPLPTLRAAYRSVLEHSNSTIRGKAAKEIARVIRREPGNVVSEYETSLFDASDIAYMVDDDRGLVVKHLVAQISDKPSIDLLGNLKGIGAFLSEAQVNELIDAVVRWVVADVRRRRSVGDFIESLWTRAPAPQDGLIAERMERWASSFAAGDRQPELVVWAQQLVDAMISFPFDEVSWQETQALTDSDVDQLLASEYGPGGDAMTESESLGAIDPGV